MSAKDGAPIVTIIAGNPLVGGQSLVFKLRCWRYDTDSQQFVDDNDSEVSAMLVSDAAHLSPAYRTLIATVTNHGYDGKYSLVIPGAELLPKMLPLLFALTRPLLVITQGVQQRLVHPLTWSGQ